MDAPAHAPPGAARAWPQTLPGQELFSAPALLGATLLLVNDIWLKRAHPGLVSGKLSDIGGLLFFPLLLTATLGWLLWLGSAVSWRLRRRPLPWAPALTWPRLLVACLLAGAGLACINLDPTCNRLWLAALAGLDVLGLFGSFRSTMDASDCVALLALLPLLWWGRRRTRQQPGRDPYAAHP